MGVQQLGVASMPGRRLRYRASTPYSTYSTYSKTVRVQRLGVHAFFGSILLQLESTIELLNQYGGNESQPWINIGNLSWPVIKDMLFMPFFVCFFLDRTPCFFARAFFVKTICFSEVFFCRKSWGGRGALMFGQSGGSESCFCYVSW